MKRIFKLVLIFLMLFTLASCGSKGKTMVGYLDKEYDGVVIEKHKIVDTTQTKLNVDVVIKTNGSQFIIEVTRSEVDIKYGNSKIVFTVIINDSNKRYKFKYDNYSKYSGIEYKFDVSGDLLAQGGILSFSNEKVNKDPYNLWQSSKIGIQDFYLDYLVKTWENKIPSDVATPSEYGFK